LQQKEVGECYGGSTMGHYSSEDYSSANPLSDFMRDETSSLSVGLGAAAAAAAGVGGGAGTRAAAAGAAAGGGGWDERAYFKRLVRLINEQEAGHGSTAIAPNPREKMPTKEPEEEQEEQAEQEEQEEQESRRRRNWKGIHPVRTNNTCMELLHKLVLPKVSSHFISRPYIDAAIGGARAGDGVEGGGRGGGDATKQPPYPPPYTVEVAGYDQFPYLCNSAYLIRTSTYARMMARPEFFHSYDELPGNRDSAARGASHCYVRGAFVVHPGYNTNTRLLEMEEEVYSELATVL
jgi:hypothetical protein